MDLRFSRLMFKKKKNDASKAQPGTPAAPAADMAQIQAAAPAPMPENNIPPGGLAPLPGSGTEGGRVPGGLKASFSNMPAAGSDAAEQAAQAAAGGKNRSKTSLLFDLILPVIVAAVCCTGFAFTVTQAKDKTGVYGLTAEQHDLEIPAKGKELADESVIAEINKLPPLKLLSQGEVQPALEAAKALALKKPNDVKSLMAAGMVMVEAGSKADREAGIKLCEKAYSQAKFSKYIRLLYARELTAMRRDEDAIAVYEKIIELFPSAWSVPHKEIAVLYMRTNSSALAVKELEALIKSDNSDPGAQRELGLALAQDGKQEEGFEEFQKGFTREQDLLGYPYAVKGIVEAHAGIVSSALKDTEKRYAKNPNELETMLTLARLYIASNKFREAREVMEKAIKLRENDPDVHEVMSEVMCRQNQSQSGYDEFRAAASHLHLK